MLPDRLVISLVNDWGLAASTLEHPSAGTMNEIAIVTTEAGKVVLRGHRRRDRRRVDFEHDVMVFARDRGVPVPEARATPSGQVVVERDGRFYSLLQHASGWQVPRDDLDESLAGSMGQTLAELHTALRTFPTDDAPWARREHSHQAALRRIGQLLERIAAMDSPGEQEAWAVERLRPRAAWLGDHPDPPTFIGDDEQLVHGDYQDSLPGSVVLFSGSAAAAR